MTKKYFRPRVGLAGLALILVGVSSIAFGESIEKDIYGEKLNIPYPEGFTSPCHESFEQWSYWNALLSQDPDKHLLTCFFSEPDIDVFVLISLGSMTIEFTESDFKSAINGYKKAAKDSYSNPEFKDRLESRVEDFVREKNKYDADLVMSQIGNDEEWISEENIFGMKGARIVATEEGEALLKTYTALLLVKGSLYAVTASHEYDGNKPDHSEALSQWINNFIRSN